MLTAREIQVNFASLSGQQALLFRSLSATEGLSQLFEFRVELLSHSHTIDLDAVLGKEMSISVLLSNGKERHFHGYVASFSYAGSEGEMALYRAILRPHLWRLTRARDCRVFQHKSVPVIVMDFLKDKHQLAHIDSHLGHPNRGNYLPWDFCVQYRETDFNFVSRLLEYEGIHYFFTHEADKHTLVLADSLTGHPKVPGYEQIIFRRGASQEHYDEGIWTWNSTRMVLPGTYAGRDFDFTTPTAKLHRASGSEVERKHAMAVTPDYEIYDYPEPVVQQTKYAPDNIQDYARIRIEEQHAQYEVISAETNARGLFAGALFKVTDGPRDEMAKTEYLIIEGSTSLHMDSYSSGGDSEVTYQSSIRAINSKHHFRPPRTTPKPLIQGPQSAVVVGKSGEKVDTDSYGRVRIQFHWDRDGKSNEDSSCWVRVSQNWAGANWGGMFLPHIGQEVLVGFMEGDPDRPIVVGRVYNANNMPPLKLPDNKHKSIIRDHFGNEIVMDGTPGNEHMSFHSPSHYSVLQLGKSSRDFTHSTKASCSYDSESYSFGKKISYTKGESFSFDRGRWLGVKAGIGGSVTVGAEVSVSGGVKLSFAAGGAVSLSASWSVAWGYARELKFTKGSYKRSSSSDVLLDSQKSVFICGGENDNSMLHSDDTSVSM
ncbi:MAG: type secretion system secreted protein VgrG, partial [Myxococcales bacterium]|nr:type secretion system secreted protein VgrG [Myxococcales bacterium]